MAIFFAYAGDINACGENTGKHHDLIHAHGSADYGNKGKHTRIIRLLKTRETGLIPRIFLG
jgi:hypothetical protein